MWVAERRRLMKVINFVIITADINMFVVAWPRCVTTAAIFCNEIV